MDAIKFVMGLFLILWIPAIIICFKVDLPKDVVGLLAIAIWIDAYIILMLLNKIN